MKRAVRAAMLAACIGMLSPLAVQAQIPEDKWTFQAILYGYFPDLGGTTKFPERTGGSTIDVSIGNILSSLNFTFMGEFEARRGRWGIFTDIIYLDVSGDKNGTRDFTIGRQGIPAGLSANLDVGIKGTLWTLGGEYLVVNDRAANVYVVYYSPQFPSGLFPQKPELAEGGFTFSQPDDPRLPDGWVGSAVVVADRPVVVVANLQSDVFQGDPVMLYNGIPVK